MKKNVSGQKVGTQMLSATDGSNFTGTVTVYITKDGGSQTIGSVASGVCTHKGKGYHEYSPSQAETNADHIAFTFEGTGALTTTVQADTEGPFSSSAIVYGTGVSASGATITATNPSSGAGIYSDWSGSVFVVEDTDDTLSLCIRQIVSQVEDQLELNDVLTFTPTSNSKYWILAGSSLELVVNSKLPLKDYLTGTNDPWGDIDGWAGSVSESEELDFTTTDRTKLNAIYNKLPSKDYITGTANSDGDIQVNEATGSFPTSAFDATVARAINPAFILSGTLVTAGDLFGTPSLTITTSAYQGSGKAAGLARCLVVGNNPSGYIAIGTIKTATNGSGTLFMSLEKDYYGTFTAGDSVTILAPSALEYTAANALWHQNPTYALHGKLVSGSAGSTSITISSDTGSWASVAADDVVRLYDNSVGKLYFNRIDVVISTTNFLLKSPMQFDVEAYEDTLDVYKDTSALGSPSLLTMARDIYAKLPSSNYLTGSAYSDGAITVGDISGLESAIVTGMQEALDGSDIQFTTDSLDIMRDHFYGGKLFVESEVDASTVTPTTTSFAGSSGLSPDDKFYSKTNAVLAFSTGDLQGLCGLVVDYTGSTRRFYFDGIWPAAPAHGDKFVLLGKITPSS